MLEEVLSNSELRGITKRNKNQTRKEAIAKKYRDCFFCVVWCLTHADFKLNSLLVFHRLSNAQKLAIRLIRILKLRVAIRKFKVRELFL